MPIIGRWCTRNIILKLRLDCTLEEGAEVTKVSTEVSAMIESYSKEVLAKIFKVITEIEIKQGRWNAPDRGGVDTWREMRGGDFKTSSTYAI